MDQHRRAFLTSVLSFSLAPLAIPAFADTYPQGPVKIVVGLAAGGATDLTARLLADQMGKGLGQRVLVENRPGGGSLIAGEFVAGSEPDGLTLFLGSGSFGTNAATSANLGFDPVADLVPITELVRAPFCIAVRPDLGVETVAELIELAKQSKRPLKYASSGTGGQAHFAGELFQAMTGTKMVHVPYKGSAPAVADVLSGELPIIFSDITSVVSRAPAGEIKILAVTTLNPSPLAPDAPTLDSQGLKGFDIAAWTILFAPAGTPEDVVAQIHSSVAEAAGDAQFVETMEKYGAEILVSAPADANRFFQKEVSTYSELAKSAELKI